MPTMSLPSEPNGLALVPPLSVPSRRACLAAAGAALLSAIGPPAAAQRPANRLAVGVEAALLASGLADRLGTALARDTGLEIEWQGGPSGALLPTLERGALDAALVFEPQLERELLAQNLVHDRRPVARTELVLVGPAPRRAARRSPAASAIGDPAGVAAGPPHDVQAALGRIAAAGARGDASFVASGEPSATQALEREAWRPLAPSAVAPWWRTAGPGPAAALEMARASGAYALVERGVWQALGAAGSGLAVLVEGDPHLAIDYRVMRAFRAPHPAGRLMVSWLAGPNGQQVVAAFARGYRPA